jgi:hypothetical protein
MKNIKEFMTESIVKRGDKWAVTNKSGDRTLGTHDTKKAALKQLAAVEISKKQRGESTVPSFKQYLEKNEECDCGCDDCVGTLEEAEYKGKKVTLNKPFRTPDASKKFAVYTKNESGKVVIVRFGDPNMEIKRDDPERRKNFRARHNCDDPGPKWKARYWSCYQWRAGAEVEG